MPSYSRKSINIFDELTGNAPVDSRFGDTPQLPEVTLENPECETLDLSAKWGDNYTHWLFDVFADVLFYLHVTGRPPRKVKLAKEALYCFHPRIWLRAFGCNEWDLKGERDVELTRVKNPLAHSSLVHPLIIEKLCAIVPKASEMFPSNPRRLLIQRAVQGPGKTQSRNFCNREEILELFASQRQPLSLVYLEGCHPWQQVAMFAQAELIISAHGSGLANLAFCKPGCKVIEITAPHHYNSTYAEIGAYKGLNMCCVKGRLWAETKDLYDYSLAVEPEFLLHLANGLT